jgi:uncharacterized RDD family membrane protein YckC
MIAEVLPTYYTGRTLGKKLLGLRVVANPGKKMTLARSTLRCFLVWILVHDFAARTQIVQVPRTRPIRVPRQRARSSPRRGDRDVSREDLR